MVSPEPGRVQTGWFWLLSAETPDAVKEGVDGGKLPVAWKMLYPVACRLLQGW
jgi:hypothetical protein